MNAAIVLGERLPALGELVQKVPAQVLAILDDLFRAKFTGVRKFAIDGKAEPAGPSRGAPK
jgi:hypothetical protein